MTAKRAQVRIEPRYLTLAQAGVYLGGRSAEAVRMMARRGRIRVIKLGKSILIDQMELDRLLTEKTVEIPE